MRGLFCFLCACSLMIAVTGPTAAQAPSDLSKDQIYSEMTNLASQMRTLKANGQESSAAYGECSARYEELSAYLGGERPGEAGGNGNAAKSRARTKVVPTTPSACGAATTTFTQSTPVVIPTGPAVVTSTLVVDGVDTYLFDLDATTFITHTFAADLDITLTSPAGTIVTLSTDNGAGNDDVFNGTLWDDSANPGGQVPYTTNNGLATDNAYVNLTLASPLVPEEAMAAFIGEDPNGTWTITISDDLAGDGGTLASWSLDVTTFAGPPTSVTEPTVTQSIPVAIPTGPAVVTSTLEVAGAGTSILDVNATTFITHTFAADLDITLTSPAGTIVTLSTDNGAGNDDVFNGTVWDDGANPSGQAPYTTNNGLASDHAYVNLTLASPLAPEEAIGAFVGENPNGTWTVTISDDLAGDGGSLASWSLDIVTFSCESADLAITKTDATVNAAPGGSTVYTITASNAGPSDADPASVVDAFPAACTDVSFTSIAAGGATGNTAAGTGGINDTALGLPAGSSVTYTATCTIDPSATGTLVNTATVASSVFDPTASNNSATDTDTLTASADLSLTKVLTEAGFVLVGDDVVFALAVTNNGPATATGVTVTDTLPAGLSYVADDCGAGFVDPTLTWDVGSLAVGASATCNLTVTVTQEGAITNTASAAGNEGDPTPANDSADGVVTAALEVAGIPTVGSAGIALMLIALGLTGAWMSRHRRLSRAER